MKEETLQAFAKELKQLLDRYDICLAAEGGNGPVQVYPGKESLYLEIQENPDGPDSVYLEA